MKIITRAEARKLGLKRYFLGPDKPCKNGHIAEKLVSNRTCVLCYEAGRKRRVQRVGATTYHGRPCKRCGGTLRYTANGDCTVCSLARVNAAYAADPEAGRAKNRAAYAKNPEPRKEKRRAYARRNRAKETAAAQARRLRDPEKARESDRRSHQRHRERYRTDPEYRAVWQAINAAWEKANPDKVKAKQRRIQKYKYNTDIIFRLARAIRNGVNGALRDGKKFSRSLETIGCSVADLVVHIEGQFRGGMTWGNWGAAEDPGGWELDHRRAVGLHDLTIRDEFFAAFHYSNLQPLLIDEHKRKTRLDHEMIRELKKRRSGSSAK